MTVLTIDNFDPPQKISAAQMHELAEGYGWSNSVRLAVAALMDELIELIRADMKEGRRLNRKDVRKNLANAANALALASKLISNSGMLGADILSHAAPSQLNTLFSGPWLYDLLPGHALLPTRPAERTRIRSRGTVSDSDLAEAVYHLMRAESPKILGAAVSQIGAALTAAIERSRQKGGRRTNPYRYLLLLNLAMIWEEKLGKDCRSPEGQTFRHFCEDIFGYKKWPKGGLERAVDKAVADYYRRRDRN